MVWGCFSDYGVGPLVKINGIMDHFAYRDILANHMVPYVDENLPLTWTFQHDNDPKHSSKLIKDFEVESWQYRSERYAPFPFCVIAVPVTR